MKKIVLLDNSLYNFYRIGATLAWWNHSNQKSLPLTTNPEFLERCFDQYLKNLVKISKKLKVDYKDFISVKDSRVEDLWKSVEYSKYKANRIYNMGDMFSIIENNFKGLYTHNIKVEGVEADDIIAVLCKTFTLMGYNIYVISFDTDFIQLKKYKNLEILNPRTLKFVECDDPITHLQQKVLKGDRTDNISSCENKTYIDVNHKININRYIQNSVLIDFDYIPRIIQDRVLRKCKDKKLISYWDIDTSLIPRHIQLGLCCINTHLKEEGVFCSRKPILKTIREKGEEFIIEVSMKNITDLISLLEWNHVNGLRILRVSSGLIPHSNLFIEYKGLDIFKDILERVGRLSRIYKQRLTFHPGQYNNIGTPHEIVFQQTLVDLDYHAQVLDLMKCDKDSVMVIHGGGTYNDKEGTIKRFIENFYKLPERIRNRLVLENDEKSYHIEDCLEMSREMNIPVVFDTHHHECYQKIHPDSSFKDVREYIPDILETWKKRGIKPKFHVSEQGEGKCGHHSDYIESLPDYLLEIPKVYGVDIDIMIEAKAKEKAVRKLYDKYPFIDPLSRLDDDL